MPAHEPPAIFRIIELLGRKWIMRIIWELREAPLTFRQLQAACGGVSPTVLNARLRDLEEARLIHKAEPNGYTLTPLGKELLVVYQPLNAWAKRWVKALG